MDDLPSELITHIGSFLYNVDDIKSCLESSKLFDSIWSSQNMHVTNVTHTNINTVLPRLHDIVSIVKARKPCIRDHEICFTCISNEITCDFELKIVDKHVRVTFICCDKRSRKHVLQLFSNGVSFSIRDIMLDMEDISELPHIHYLATCMTSKNIQLLHDDKFCTVPEICILLFENTTYDLSRIDETKNKILGICASNNEITLVDAQKITDLAIHVKNNQKLYDSFKVNSQNRRTRLRSIFIECKDMHEDTGFIDFASKFGYCSFYVTVEHPNTLIMIEKLQKIGIRNIYYTTKCTDTYFAALLFKHIYPKYNFEIVKHKWYKQSSVEINTDFASKTIHEIYDAMQENEKIVWNSIYERFTSSQNHI